MLCFWGGALKEIFLYERILCGSSARRNRRRILPEELNLIDIHGAVPIRIVRGVAQRGREVHHFQVGDAAEYCREQFHVSGAHRLAYQRVVGEAVVVGNCLEQLHHLLGKGASAKVYAGSLFGGQDGKSLKVAVKQVTVKQSRRAGTAQQNMGVVLEQEVKMLSQLSHPSIVGYLGVFKPRVPPQQPKQYMIIMEYCGCGDLVRHARDRPLYSAASE